MVSPLVATSVIAVVMSLTNAMQFRIQTLLIGIAIIAVTLAFPAASFVLLLIVSFCMIVTTVVHSTTVFSEHPTQSPSRLLLRSCSLAIAILSVVGWVASEFWLVRHHIQNVATLDIGPHAIGLTIGEYYTADRQWSVVPASWMTPENTPRIQFATSPPPYQQSFEMWIPFWLLLVISGTSTCIEYVPFFRKSTKAT